MFGPFNQTYTIFISLLIIFWTKKNLFKVMAESVYVAGCKMLSSFWDGSETENN